MNRSAVNEYGSSVSVLTCRTCGRGFTVCPAIPADRRDEWRDCLSEDCPSYQPTRDADLYFLLGEVVVSDG